ncbi:MAG: biotin--[acetyl-CoA-carboxylase] ligase [Chloroflexi bacterium]|nr:biotin--[acetyl-CoA-carboxylase] ligase [Chloroflexota bacterium]
MDLSPDSITENLGTRFVGRKIMYYESLGSTMEVARQEARRGAAEGTAVIAAEQTAGRGRLGRAWLSPRGSISVSIILRPRLGYLPFLTMLASLAAVYAIEAITGLKPQIKWPNDVLITGRKVCGVLVESEVSGNRVDYAVIGCGINANLNVSDFPEIEPVATSLASELGREVSTLHLLRRLLVETEKLYLALPAGESIYREWKQRLETLGKKIRVKSGETAYEGIAESVAGDGSLLLRRPDGSSVSLVSGEITLHG